MNNIIVEIINIDLIAIWNLSVVNLCVCTLLKSFDVTMLPQIKKNRFGLSGTRNNLCHLYCISEILSIMAAVVKQQQLNEEKIIFSPTPPS